LSYLSEEYLMMRNLTLQRKNTVKLGRQKLLLWLLVWIVWNSVKL